MGRGLPFDVKIPNEETVAALNEELGKAERFATVGALMNDLKSSDGA